MIYSRFVATYVRQQRLKMKQLTLISVAQARLDADVRSSAAAPWQLRYWPEASGAPTLPGPSTGQYLTSRHVTDTCRPLQYVHCSLTLLKLHLALLHCMGHCFSFHFISLCTFPDHRVIHCGGSHRIAAFTLGAQPQSRGNSLTTPARYKWLAGASGYRYIFSSSP